MKELILNFHGIGVTPPATERPEQHYWLDESTFSALLDAILAWKREGALDVVITLDDGNRSDVDVALPALVSRGLTARFFVCAGRIGTAHYLHGTALADMIDAGMIVGSHGMNHVDWRRASTNELDNEISGARRKLEDVCGRAVDEVAIPFGSYDRRVLSRLQAERLRCVYTSDGGTADTNSWLKPRNSVDVSWHVADISRHLKQSAAPFFRLTRSMAMLYKSIR